LTSEPIESYFVLTHDLKLMMLSLSPERPQSLPISLYCHLTLNNFEPTYKRDSCVQEHNVPA
jgi:hypothetical protein